MASDTKKFVSLEKACSSTGKDISNFLQKAIDKQIALYVWVPEHTFCYSISPSNAEKYTPPPAQNQRDREWLELNSPGAKPFRIRNLELLRVNPSTCKKILRSGLSTQTFFDGYLRNEDRPLTRNIEADRFQLVNHTQHSRAPHTCIAVSKQYGEYLPHMTFEVTAIRITTEDLLISSDALIDPKEDNPKTEIPNAKNFSTSSDAPIVPEEAPFHAESSNTDDPPNPSVASLAPEEAPSQSESENTNDLLSSSNAPIVQEETPSQYESANTDNILNSSVTPLDQKETLAQAEIINSESIAVSSATPIDQIEKPPQTEIVNTDTPLKSPDVQIEINEPHPPTESADTDTPLNYSDAQIDKKETPPKVEIAKSGNLLNTSDTLLDENKTPPQDEIIETKTSINLTKQQIEALLPEIKKRTPRLHELITFALETWDRNFKDYEFYPTNEKVAEQLKDAYKFRKYPSKTALQLASAIRPDPIGRQTQPDGEREEARMNAVVSKDLLILIDIESRMATSESRIDIFKELNRDHGFGPTKARICKQLFRKDSEKT